VEIGYLDSDDRETGHRPVRNVRSGYFWWDEVIHFQRNDEMKAIALCAVVTVLVAFPESHAAEQVGRSELDALKSQYEEAQVTIDAAFAEKQSVALTSYGKSLDAYLAYLKKGGKLDAYLELEKEKTRFKAEQTVVPESRDSVYANKAAAQYEAAIGKATTDKQARTAHLAKQYTIRLEALIKEFMQADRWIGNRFSR
jgi:hypothetical protein